MQRLTVAVSVCVVSRRWYISTESNNAFSGSVSMRLGGRIVVHCTVTGVILRRRLCILLFLAAFLQPSALLYVSFLPRRSSAVVFAQCCSSEHTSHETGLVSSLFPPPLPSPRHCFIPSTCLIVMFVAYTRVCLLFKSQARDFYHHISLRDGPFSLFSFRWIQISWCCTHSSR